MFRGDLGAGQDNPEIVLRLERGERVRGEVMALLPAPLLPSLASPKSIRAQVGSENAAAEPSSVCLPSLFPSFLSDVEPSALSVSLLCSFGSSTLLCKEAEVRLEQSLTSFDLHGAEIRLL